ncbi:MAG: hypothetical protein DRI69_12025, partial [Bacteroidetes bacterium]
YYLHSTKYQGDFQTELLDFPQFQDSITTDYYLIITKSTTDQGVYSGYEVFLNLPTVAPFDTLISADITAIARLIKYEIESIHVPGGNVTYSKEGIAAGLDLLATIIESIVNKTFSLTELQQLSLNDFIEIPIGDVQLTHTGNTTLLGSGFFDYTGLQSTANGISMIDTMFASWEKHTDVANIITDTENLSGFQGGQFPAADSNFVESGANFVFWYHFMLPAQGSGEPLRLFVKMRTSLTQDEAANMMYSLYLETRGQTSGSALKGGDGNGIATRMSEGGCGELQTCNKFDSSWRLKGCLDDYEDFREDLVDKLGLQNVPIDIVDYQIGVYAGIVDGCLDVVMPIIFGAGSVVDGVADALKGESWDKLNWAGRTFLAFVSIASYNSNPLSAYYLSLYYNDLKSTYNQLKTLISSDSLYHSIITPIRTALEDFLSDLTFQNGSVCAGHAAGIVIFELVVGIVSGGTSQYKNVVSAVGKSFRNLGGIKKVLMEGVSGGFSAVKKIRCRILAGGCFVVGTPILMAGNPFRNTAKGLALAVMPIVAVPIQEVQLLDYAIAHGTVNSTYGLTAGTDEDIYLRLLDKDPYTSNQQKERDQCEINDTDWSEVVFEEVLGTSIAKLALHQDWIDQKSYVVDGVVKMDLPEQEISGAFKITSIKHIIPQKKPVDDDPDDDYEFKPVMALFIHQSDQVYSITFDNKEEIGVTYQHPIYSVTASDWRLAGELEVGEKVLAKFGETSVTSSEKKEGSETVYNLEVKDLHNFLVGASGVVVHNACIPPIKPLISNMAQVFDNWVSAFKPIVRQATTDYYKYQKRILGTLTERRIPLKKPHNFTKDNLDVDGFELSTGTLIDTKYVGNPSNSPYTGASNFPPIQDDLLDELKRYKHIINDVDTPVRALKIVTNNEQAKTYLEGIMNSLSIPGGVVVIK